MSTLAETYHNLQKENIIPIKGDINRLLKDRLKNRFKDQLSLFQKGQGKADLVYSDETPKKDGVKLHSKKYRRGCIFHKRGHQGHRGHLLKGF